MHRCAYRLIRFAVVGLGIALSVAACRPAAEAPPKSNPTATVNPVSPTAQTSPAAGSSAGIISDDETRSLMHILGGLEPGDADAAIDRITAAADKRFIAVFIDLMRAAHIGLVDGSNYPRYIEALEMLSGESFGEDWVAWFEWYGRSDLTPPPGFTGWKGLLLAQIDPGFAAFLQDSLPSRVRVEEIQWGGVVVDGIPALDNPSMLEATEADYLEPGDAVFGLTINGESRAYPLRILDWHEMANDEIGGVPVSLAYCTLCGAAIAYDGRGPDGVTYTFGSSGFLYRSNKLMYDRPTRTLWNHLTGEPVLGKLAGTELRLKLLPVVLATWDAWQAQHPDTLVVDIDTGFNRDYSTGAAYADYFADKGTMFPVWQRSDLLEQKAQVYALRIDGIPKAYPVEAFAGEPVINDTVGATPIVLIGSEEMVILEGSSRRMESPRTWSAGSEIRAYIRDGETFAPGDTPNTVLDARGRVWQVTEEALIGPDGEAPARLPGHLAYWFGWFAFFPETEVHGMP
jgi:hypothetical protein